ncbi:MAG: tRNA lysidine(34) synthetase TilS [Gracilimonas sp.]|uniref:tRNA lysidine(34) synthetase TilS n=1 Tax=Gracilimonas sp. TaxID=1974203 RepID=UPI0019A97A94|nr:tRNA lysidine(34) synthetase TilS [Gracilimonas sp.]MBD3617525.1 tRNA lysidine(34) synthetase TilS [Gracilimonas sp.]
MAKSISKKLRDHLSNCLSDYFEEGALFVIGVSGGPDSMALLYLFHLLDVDVLTVHVNYGKRGKQADKDQELVEQMAFAWGFECCSIRLDPKEAKDRNFQDWARQQRYQFFRDLRDDFKADAIVTAHHQDDQVETILQKIFRGSAPTAWQGMQIWDGKLFRPLLPFSKEEILDFCELESVPYRIDKSNERSDFARNFIRNEFSEKMDRFFPGWKKNILDLPNQGKSFEAGMAALADQVSQNNTIYLKKFAELPETVKPAVIKTILDQFGMKSEYSKGQLKELAEIETLQTGKNLKIGNLLLTRDRDKIHLHTDKENEKVQVIISKEQAEKGVKEGEISLKTAHNLDTDANLKLDQDKLSWPVTLRSWQAGDSFQPLGMEGNQKISDHLTNRKIPTTIREKGLVLCGSDGTIYAIIYPALSANEEWGAIAEMAKLTSTTQTLLTINIL